MTTQRITHRLIRKPGHVFGDEIIEGMRIIPPGRTRPVEVVYVTDDAAPGEREGEVFFLACHSGQGHRVVRLHRSDQVLTVRR